MFYQEGSSLDFDLIVLNYEDDRSRYWADDDQARKFLELIDGLAETLLRGSQGLVAPADNSDTKSFTWDQVRFLTNQESIADRVLERLEIDTARAFCIETRAMARRALELASLVVAVEPNDAVVRFLSRLSRCYIAGFIPECLMLCRSVLENAIIERVGSNDSMKVRIARARRSGQLSDDGCETAELIWKQGNRAIHELPDETADALEAIRLTLKVLGELYPSTGDINLDQP